MSRPRRVRRRAFPTAPVKPPNSARNQLVKVPYFLISTPFTQRCPCSFFFSFFIFYKFLLAAMLIITVVTFFFFLSFLSFFLPFDSLACHIRWTNKPHCWAGEFLLRESVSPMIQWCQKKTKQKIANTKTVTGAWEKEGSEWMVTAVPRRSFSVSQCGGWTSDKDVG